MENNEYMDEYRKKKKRQHLAYEQRQRIDDAEQQYQQNNNLSAYIVFWELLWEEETLLVENDSGLLFRMADLYIEAARYDDALEFVRMVHMSKPAFAETAEKYTDRILKMRGKSAKSRAKKENQKSGSYAPIIIILAIVIFFAFWALQSVSELEQRTNPKTTVAETTPLPTLPTEAEPTTIPATEPETTETVPEETVWTQDSKALIKAASQFYFSQFFDIVEIEVEDSGITCILGKNGLAEIVTTAIARNDDVSSDWNSIIKNLQNMSKEEESLAEKYSLQNSNVVIYLVNDANTDMVFLSMANGVVIYNVFDSQ